MNFDTLHKTVLDHTWSQYHLPFNKQKEKVTYNRIKPKGIEVYNCKRRELKNPFYYTTRDVIFLHNQRQFSEGEYYAILFHELAHATGAASRLNRDTIIRIPHITIRQKAEEEIIAETASLLLCEHFKLDINYELHINYIRTYKTEYFKNSGFPGLSRESFKKCFEEAEKAYRYILDNMLEVSDV